MSAENESLTTTTPLKKRGAKNRSNGALLFLL